MYLETRVNITQVLDVSIQRLDIYYYNTKAKEEKTNFQHISVKFYFLDLRLDF